MSGSGTQRYSEANSNSHNIVVRKSFSAAEEGSDWFELASTGIDNSVHDSMVARCKLQYYCWRHLKETISRLRIDNGMPTLH